MTASPFPSSFCLRFQAFSIEPFKHPIDKMGSQNRDAMWAVLESAIREIHQGRSGQLSFEELYRTGYYMVVYKFGSFLYQGFLDTEQSILKRVAADLAAAPRETLLEATRARWAEHTRSLGMVKDVLMYLDRVFVAAHRLPSVWEAGLALWRDAVLRDPAVAGPLRECALLAAARARAGRGSPGDAALLRACTRMWEDVGRDVYASDFEAPFLRAAAEHHAREAAEALATLDPPAYLALAERALEREAALVAACLSPSSEKAALRCALLERVEKPLPRLIADPTLGLVAMVRAERRRDLLRLATLAARVRGGTDLLAAALGAHWREEGRAAMRAAGGSPRELVALVDALLAARDRALAVVRSSLLGDRRFVDALNGAFEAFLNEDPRAPEAVSLYADDALRRGRAAKAGADGADGADAGAGRGSADEAAAAAPGGPFAPAGAPAPPASASGSSAPPSSSTPPPLAQGPTQPGSPARGAAGAGAAEAGPGGDLGANLGSAPAPASAPPPPLLLESTVDRVIVLFRYLRDKDVFERCYKRHLAGRLLRGRASEAGERAVLARLRAECGYQFTSKLETMLNDVNTSRDVLDKYQREREAAAAAATHAGGAAGASSGTGSHAGGAAGASGGAAGPSSADASSSAFAPSSSATPSSLDLSVQVLTTGAWPLPPPAPAVRLPSEMGAAAAAFGEHYVRAYAGRRLAWQPALGSVELRATFGGRAHELVASVPQAALLCLFDGPEGEGPEPDAAEGGQRARADAGDAGGTEPAKRARKTRAERADGRRPGPAEGGEDAVGEGREAPTLRLTLAEAAARLGTTPDDLRRVAQSLVCVPGRDVLKRERKAEDAGGSGAGAGASASAGPAPASASAPLPSSSSSSSPSPSPSSSSPLPEDASAMVRDDDVLSVNEAFSSRLFRVRLCPVSHAKESAGGVAATRERAEEDRKPITEAAIVRVMKARRTLTHAQLVAEVSSQLAPRFRAQPAAIKKRLENLIEREFIERDEHDTNVYRYVA